MRQSCPAIAAGLALLAVIAAAMPAAAQSALSERTIHRDVMVRYGDLNLADERDVSILLSRIDKAAEEACGGRPWISDTFTDVGTSTLREQYRHCHVDAVARAVESVGAPLVKRHLAQAE